MYMAHTYDMGFCLGWGTGDGNGSEIVKHLMDFTKMSSQNPLFEHRTYTNKREACAF